MKPTLLVSLLVLTSALSPAAVIFANGTPDLTQPDARNITFYRVAEDFTLGAPSTIESVRFWMVANAPEFGGTISYAFYQDSGGAVGSLITSGSISNPTVTLLGSIPAFVQSNFLVDFNLPSVLNLAAGTYWLEIHDGPSLNVSTNAEVAWNTVANTVGNAVQGPVANVPAAVIPQAMAFSLNGSVSTAPPAVTAVPEPSTLAISLAGLIALALLRARS